MRRIHFFIAALATYLPTTQSTLAAQRPASRPKPSRSCSTSTAPRTTLLLFLLLCFALPASSIPHVRPPNDDRAILIIPAAPGEKHRNVHIHAPRSAIPAQLPGHLRPALSTSQTQHDRVARRLNIVPKPPTSPSTSRRNLLSKKILSKVLSTLPPALPSCALQCYITALTTSTACPSESDLKCHCSASGGGNILVRTASCVKSACSKADQKEAEDAMKGMCADVGVDVGDGGGGNGNGNGDTTSTQTPTTPSSSIPASVPISTRSSPSSTPPTDSSPNLPSATASAPTQTPAPTSTTSPFAPAPVSHLSTGAKAGIAVSVTLLFSSLLLITTLYIRRLKRDLRVAQAAATNTAVSELPNGGETDMEEAAAGGFVPRRASWRSGGSRRGRRGSADRSRSESPLSPVSPLSPREGFADGVLKKKRGTALSLIIERIDEDDRSTLNTGRMSARMSGGLPVRTMVHEPVPGQREGLVDPLELDSQGIVEMPLSVTPRERSMERTRSRGRSFGEEWEQAQVGRNML